MIRKLGTLTAGLMLASASWEATAVGFGTLPSSAVLGQPLQLAIPLRLEPGETLGPDCLTGEVQFADSRQQPGTTSLRLDPALPSSTDRVLRLTTTTRVDEPIVTVEITLGCGAKVTRRFTLFADPPLLATPEPAMAAAEPAPPPPSAPPPAVAASEPAAPAPSPPRARSESAAAAPVAPPRRAAPRPAASPNTAAPTAPRRSQAARAAPSGAPRLSLSPLEPGALVAQARPPSAAEQAASAAAAEQAASAAAAAAAASAAADAAMAESRKRVAELEAAVAKLRADTANSQKTIDGLQTRLLRAEDVRYDHPLVYGLAALLLLLAGALFWMWRQLRQEREAHAWLAQATAAGGTTASTRAPLQPLAGEPQPAAPPVPTLNAWVSKPSPVDGFDETRAVTRADAHTLGGPTSGPGALSQPESKREVSVEELIDLEQQAEFFVVLGQDAAAIDLLMGHVRSTAASPLPYLKLLEIYKRLGERAEYERVRERFNSRFNAYAPAWETDLQAGRSLEDYPHVMGRLQSLWSTPRQALKVLEATLLRAEGAEADTGGAHAFELPAYRELLMLYAVARDLAEDDSGAVDLLLPLEDAPETGPDSLYGGVYERLLATTSLAAQPQAQKPLSVDLQLDDLGEAPVEGSISLELPPIVDPKAPR